MRVRFHLPDFSGNFKLNLMFTEMLKNRPEYFREGVEIASFYGVFPPCLWNGGRAQGGNTDKNFIKASYICGGILSASVLFFIFEMFTVADFGISIEWNIFESAWASILFPVGFVLAIINWGKFGHWSMQAYDVYKDSSGKKYVVRLD